MNLRLFFEHLAQEWDDQQPSDRQLILDQLVSRIAHHVQDTGMLLEVGTGTGGLIPVLKKHFPKSMIISIDFANAMLMQARKLNGCVVQADVHHLSFTDRQFSSVICHNSFPHFKDKLHSLREIRRVLQPQGSLLIMHELSREKVNYIHQTARAVEIHQDLLPPGDELAGWLLQAGFTPTIIEDAQDHYVACARV